MADPAGSGFRFPMTFRSRIEDDDAPSGRARRSRVFVETLRKQMDEIKATPQFTPEQLAARQYENDKQYKLGMLMSMSGGEGLQQAGGQMFRHALAQRSPQVTEHGMANPLTGEFTYSPDYQRRQLQTRIDAAEQRAAQDEDQAYERMTAREDRQQHARDMLANKPDNSAVVVIGPDGVPRWSGRSTAVAGGLEAPPTATGAAQPSGEERKAATLLQRLDFSRRQLEQAIKESPAAAVSTIANKGMQSVPVVGQDLANIAQSPARQRVEAAQLDILDAALTLGTGAAYTREQLLGYARSYFPQPGDDATTRADKKARLDNVIKAAEIAAGRAGPGAPPRRVPGAPPAAAAPRVKFADLPEN